MLGFVPRLWKPTQSSVDFPWFASSHFRKSAGDSKNRIGTTINYHFPGIDFGGERS
jgi:hypothetical protein